MHGQRWMFANLNETLCHKKWLSMPVVREWHMHAKCDQIYYVVKSYEQFHELLTDGRADELK